MALDWDFMFHSIPMFLKGLELTLYISFLGFCSLFWWGFCARSFCILKRALSPLSSISMAKSLGTRPYSSSFSFILRVE